MSARNKHIPGPPRDPNIWLHFFCGQVSANHAEAADVDKKPIAISFVANGSNFLSGLISTLKGGGDVFRDLEAPVYPYDDAHEYDLKCLGADMYAALVSHSMSEMTDAGRTKSGQASRQNR